MTDPLVLSIVVLWVIVVALGVCVLALSRQIGILYERVAPMGALMMDHGPKVGELAPPVDVTTWDGEALTIGAGMKKSTLLFFVSPTCPVCKKLLPMMRSVRNREGTLVGNNVYNLKDEDLGEIKEIMLDMRTGRVSYAVLSFGGFLGMGDKLFAVPWEALTLDTVNKRFVLNAEKDRLENAPGFDKDKWPNMADSSWAEGIHAYYGTTPRLDNLSV